MIYQLTTADFPVSNYDIFRALPPQMWGEWLWFGMIAVLLVILVAAAFGKNPPRWLALAVPSLLFAGAFVANYQLLDEVAVNFQHPYNLWHHGFFSMQPDAMVDGTVEWLFYLLHLPFAWSQTSLVMGNFILTLLIGWLHIFCLWKFRVFEGRMNGVLPLALIASCFGLIGLWANGFGNVLLSLVFLLAFIAQVKNRPILALFIGGFLPLLRPEGIVWSAVNGVAVLLSSKGRRKLLRYPKFYIAALSPFASMFVYFGFYKIFYGYWLPTPLLFKATALGKLSDLHWSLLPFGLNAIRLNYSLIEPMLLLVVVIMLIPTLYYGLNRPDKSYFSRLFHAFNERVMRWMLRGRVHEFKVFATYFAVSACIMLFWFLTNFTYTNPIDRYYLIFFLCLTLFTVKLLTVALSDVAFSHAVDFYTNEKLERHAHSLRFMAWGAVFVFIAVTLPQKNDIDIRNSWLYNRANMAMAGALTDKLAPKDWVLAASEMNTFGFMANRKLVDLWGYSNRSIATSNMCTQYKVRVLKDAFLTAKPDLYFYHWFTEFPTENNYETFEESFMHSLHSHANLGYSRISGLKAVFEQYDAIILRAGAKQVAYLVRHPLTAGFIKNLEGAGFSLQKSRKINPRLFEDDKLRTFTPC